MSRVVSLPDGTVLVADLLPAGSELVRIHRDAATPYERMIVVSPDGEAIHLHVARRAGRAVSGGEAGALGSPRPRQQDGPLGRTAAGLSAGRACIRARKTGVSAGVKRQPDRPRKRANPPMCQPIAAEGLSDVVRLISKHLHQLRQPFNNIEKLPDPTTENHTCNLHMVDAPSFCPAMALHPRREKFLKICL
jgi:hypothetical protein